MRTMIMTLVLSSLVASPALARRGGGGMGGKGAGGPGGGGRFNPVRIEAVAAQLGVDDTTLAAIKNLTFKAEQEAIGIGADVQREQLELRKLMDVDVPDERAVMRQIDDVMAQEARMRKNRVGLLLAVRKLLTPEQRAQLEQLMMQRRGRMGAGGPGGSGAGKGPGAGMGPGRGGRGGRGAR